jgi:hypothetical protein
MEKLTKTQLEIIGDQQRAELMPKNYYHNKGAYSSSHKNAMSDGDDLGKGENGGSIGGKTDIITRVDNIKSNKFNEKNKYPNF